MHFLLIEHSGLSWRSCQEKKNNLSQQEMYNLTEHLLGSTVKNKVGLVQVSFMPQTVWYRHPHAVRVSGWLAVDQPGFTKLTTLMAIIAL